MIPFRVQYDKLIKAYLKNEVKPTDPCKCFVGNLLNNVHYWRYARKKNWLGDSYDNPDFLVKEGLKAIAKESDNMYTVEEISELEDIFMNTSCNFGVDEEELIYSGFEKCLLRLKEIHESKGEIVESYIFTKRELQPVL